MINDDVAIVFATMNIQEARLACTIVTWASVPPCGHSENNTVIHKDEAKVFYNFLIIVIPDIFHLFNFTEHNFKSNHH